MKPVGKVVAAAVVFIATLHPVAVGAAPVFSDGFESGSLSAWSGSANVTVQDQITSAGRWAARATSTGSPSHAWRTFPTRAELWSTTWFSIVTRSGPVWLTSIRKTGGGAILHVGLNSNGRLIARNVVAKTTYTSAVTVAAGAWHRMQVHVRVGVGAGFDVSLDGIPVAGLSRSVNLGGANPGRIGIGDSTSGRRFDVAFDDVAVATDGGATDVTPPTAPTSLTAEARDDAVAVQLSWSPSTDDTGVTGYEVFRSLDGVAFSSLATVATPGFLDTQLDPGTTYWWRVDAADAAGNRSAPSEVVSATTSSIDPAATMGAWGPPFDVGVAAVHAAMLFTGKVLLWERTTAGVSTLAKLWDPATGIVTDVSVPAATEHNLFCSGHALRPNGDLLVTGGTLWGGSNPNGTEQTAFFDPIAERWREGPPMAWERWYPTDVTLPGGDVIVIGGAVNSTTKANVMERYSEASGSFSSLPPSATLQMNYYPRMFVLGDGRVVRVLPENKTMYFDPSDATWTNGPSMNVGGRNLGGAVLLDDAERVLVFGGSSPTTDTAQMIDFGADQPQWRFVESMDEPRRNLNSVLLPDGEVLVIGGNRGSGSYDSPVFASELFDPETERWTTVAAHTAPRAYHSTALLLPDGRVLSAGQTSGTMQRTAEVYSPPYLFKGPRPVIDDAPEAIGYDATFEVATSQAADIERVSLVRAGTVTHSTNFDQRSLALPFTRGAGGLTVEGPDASVDAPPGWYMLFVVDDVGVPSVARWVQVS